MVLSFKLVHVTDCQNACVRETNIKYSQACKSNFEYVRPYVDKALRRHSKKTQGAQTIANGGKEATKAKKWVALNELAAADEYLTQNKADKDALASHAMGFLLAGRDTTSAMLSWAVSDSLSAVEWHY